MLAELRKESALTAIAGDNRLQSSFFPELAPPAG